MRILVHIHTWNDTDSIGTALDAVLHQTFKVDEILIVDNGSTDGTAEMAFPDHVTVIRHGLNLGTSGAVKTGLEYAIAHGYDGIWVLDADSLPRSDALGLLVGVVEAEGRQVGAVCSSHNLVALSGGCCAAACSHRAGLGCLGWFRTETRMNATA